MKKKRIFFTIVFLSVISFLGISKVSAETLDSINWVNTLGRDWTLSGQEFSSNKNYNSYWLLNPYPVVNGVYTPPADTDFVKDLFFGRHGSVYNPCNGSGFIMSFNILVENSTFINYLNNITFNTSQCEITGIDGSNISVKCVVPYSTNTFNTIFVNFNEISSSSPISSNVYISRQMDLSCNLDTGAIISNQNANQQQTNERLEEINKSSIETNNNLQSIESSINNTATAGATDSANSFFSGFETNTFGLTSIITAPLQLIGSITSSTCSDLALPLPYIDKTLKLPCMSTIYQRYFGGFYTLYQTITFGIVAYWVCIRIFALVKDFKNPDHDEIEVFDL